MDDHKESTFLISTVNIHYEKFLVSNFMKSKCFQPLETLETLVNFKSETQSFRFSKHILLICHKLCRKNERKCDCHDLDHYRNIHKSQVLKCDHLDGVFENHFSHRHRPPYQFTFEREML